MYQDDWIMRQIQMMAHMIARVLFHKDVIRYEITDEQHMSDADFMHRQLGELIDRLELNEAENRLFDFLEPGRADHLMLAMDFYGRLNALSDEQLQSAGFVREEIERGMRDAAKRYGLSGFMEG